MLDMWTDLIKNVAILGALLLAATLLRAKIKIFQRFYIPNSIIAGFLGLILGTQVLKLFSISATSLKDYIYHLLGITFIALSLKKAEGAKGKNSFRTSLAFAMGYGTQAFIGFGLALLIFSQLYPLFTPANGVLLELGFSNSPAVAYNIGSGWVKILSEIPERGAELVKSTGVEYSGDIGLTFGAIGFLIACIAGVILINYGVKKGYTTFLKKSDDISDNVKKGYVVDSGKQKEAGRLTTSSEAIDSMTLHVSIILVIYIMTYYLLKLILYGIDSMPEGVSFLARVVVNFHFIIGALLAMLVKKVMRLIKIDFLIDNGITQRISGLSVDFMVVAAISAISLKVVVEFIVPIVVLSATASFSTFLYCAYLGSRSFDDYKFERIITIFGIATGTMATGMALLRVMDPELKSPVAKNIMYGSGIAFFFAMPIMVLINLPIKALITGNNSLNWIALGLVGAYVLVVMFIWRITGLIKFKKPHGKLWNMD